MQLSKFILFIALIFIGASQADPQPKGFVQVIEIDANNAWGWVCQNIPFMPPNACPTTKTPTQSTTPATMTTTHVDFTQGTSAATNTFTLPTTTPPTSNQGSSSSPSPLQSAHWCYLKNGTYLPLGYGFMSSPCVICQCTQSHDVRCAQLGCMNTSCMDDSMPATRPGECCSQCAYEAKALPCFYNGISFPHGTILKSTSDNVKCWCQSGNVECRSSGISVFSSLDLWGNGTAVYVIVVVVIGVILMGTVLCCGCTLLYYYYYEKNQHVVQQVYDEYINNSGWEPVGEEGVVTDANGEQQATDGEKQPFDYTNGVSEAYFAPPYELYNGSYVNEEKPKDSTYL